MGEKYQDKNLNYKRWRDVTVLDIPVMDYWKEWVGQSRKRARTILMEDPSLQKLSVDAVNKAKTLNAGRFAQLLTRSAQSKSRDAEVQREFLELEKTVANKLYDGMLSPKITLDTVAAMFVSGQPLKNSCDNNDN